MKIKDLPQKTKAVRQLKRLSLPAAMERLRCAQAAVDMALWCHEKYKDEPSQWIRSEQILSEILRDPEVKIEWFIAARSKDSPEGANDKEKK